MSGWYGKSRCRVIYWVKAVSMRSCMWRVVRYIYKSSTPDITEILMKSTSTYVTILPPQAPTHYSIYPPTHYSIYPPTHYSIYPPTQLPLTSSYSYSPSYPHNARTSIRLRPFGHEILVELFNLAHIIFYTRTQGGHSKMIRSWFLTET